MKYILIFLVSFVSISASATTVSLEERVAGDIQGLVDDTVNEGEQSAHVVYKKSKPEVECKLSENNMQPKKKWAFCHVQFQVTYEESSENRSCALLYVFDPKKITVERGDEKSFQNCLENLAESID